MDKLLIYSGNQIATSRMQHPVIQLLVWHVRELLPSLDSLEQWDQDGARVFLVEKNRYMFIINAYKFFLLKLILNVIHAILSSV